VHTRIIRLTFKRGISILLIVSGIMLLLISGSALKAFRRL